MVGNTSLYAEVFHALLFKVSYTFSFILQSAIKAMLLSGSLPLTKGHRIS